MKKAAMVLAISLSLTVLFIAGFPGLGNAQQIYGCYGKYGGLLRVVGSPNQCNARLETPISWNAVGPQGQQGPKGDTGDTGPVGPAPKYAKVAVVAQSGGDYTDPSTAMSGVSTWCGTPSATNPCLLKIMPGVYDIGTNSIQMQEYIDIEGSGENTTKIRGNITWPGNVEGVVNGANNAEIRFLTVENTGASTGIQKTAIYNNNSSPKMTNITATVSGASYNYAVLNYYSSPTMTNVTVMASGSGGTDSIVENIGLSNSSSSPTMINVTVTASGGTDSYGIWNDVNSSPTMTNVTVMASGGTTYNVGIETGNSSSPTMMNGTVTASGGLEAIGLRNYASSPTMTNVTINVSGGTRINRGVASVSLGTIRINDSAIIAPLVGPVIGIPIQNGTDSTIYVANTRLEGWYTSLNNGTLKCVGVYDGNYDPYTCPP